MTDRHPVTTDERRHLDELVPAPWSVRRRRLTFLLALVCAVAVVAVVRSGALGPRLTHENGWGAGTNLDDGATRIDVERIAPIRNTGWLPVTIESLPFPDLDGVTWGEVEGLPATLEPGETLELGIPLEVAGCDLDLGGFDVFPIRARSGLAPARVVEVAAPSSDPPSGPVIHADADGNETRIPGFPEQQPSWILDAIEHVCMAPPEGAP